MTVKLNKDILIRYEHNLYSGTLILYNVKTQEFWFGNESSHAIIQLIDGQKSLDEIYGKVLPEFPGYALEQLMQSFNALIKELIEKKFIEVVAL